MEQINLKAVVRQDKGKQKVKKLRSSGWIPGVVYHRGEKPVEVSVDNKELLKIIRAHSGENILINMTIEGEDKNPPTIKTSVGVRRRTDGGRAVIIKELQHHPVKRGILHVDFNEISLTEKITVEVEILALGEPSGVKQEGGILDRPLRAVKLQCLPADIPKHIDVDVSGLKLNGLIHVRDLVVSDKIKILTDPDAVLFLVKLPVEEKVEETALEGTPEVEVIREKKEEETKPGAEKPAEKAKEEPKAEKK